MTDITTGLKIIDEIDTSKVAPEFCSPEEGSLVETILGRPARVLPAGDDPAAMAYVIGKGKGLQAGKAYVLAVEYPDDIPRTIFLINRGSDYYRGWATGTATGDVRGQYAEPVLESLEYPQTGQWQTFKQFFYLLNKFQGVVGVRNPDKPGIRPYLPENGFHVVIFQSKKINDPRSEGAAVGRIRLYEVPNPSSLFAKINYPPDDLPRRRIFWREEMADNLLENPDPNVLPVEDPLDWYRYKMRMAKVLGINTFTKDLLEFGFNQGWETGDQNWVGEAQPPNKDLWTKLVPVATEEGMDIIPYFEYKTGIGLTNESLARQRRAKKLYDGLKKTGGSMDNYTAIWWTEATNGDLTDPETLKDAKRMLDKTMVEFSSQGKFAGVWLRARGSHLPMSFSADAIERFRMDNQMDAESAKADQSTLIASYEGDQALYKKYVAWWFGKRAKFLTALRDHLRVQLRQSEVQVLFTPWPGEPVPIVQSKASHYGHPGVVTDNPEWWKDFANTQEESGVWKWQWMPTSFEDVISHGLYRKALQERPPINFGINLESYGNLEIFHSAPHADPENYKKIDDVMMTYPIGRLFTVADSTLMEEYRCANGLTVVRHYPLNEDSGDPKVEPSPFGTLVGYICVDCDRAGNHMLLDQARAIANGDPRNIAYLCGSSFSTGFPEILRRFNQAFLAVPALPSKRLEGASSDPEVVVREIATPGKGTYYFVVNTSLEKKQGVTVTLPAKGAVTTLVTGAPESGTVLKLDMESADLRSYRVGP